MKRGNPGISLELVSRLANLRHQLDIKNLEERQKKEQEEIKQRQQNKDAAAKLTNESKWKWKDISNVIKEMSEVKDNESAQQAMTKLYDLITQYTNAMKTLNNLIQNGKKESVEYKSTKKSLKSLFNKIEKGAKEMKQQYLQDKVIDTVSTTKTVETDEFVDIDFGEQEPPLDWMTELVSQLFNFLQIQINQVFVPVSS